MKISSGKGFNNFAFSKNWADFLRRFAKKNNIENETVYKAVENTSKINKELSVEHLNGPVSASSSASNFKLLRGINIDIQG